MRAGATYHGGPVVKIAKQSFGFDGRAYRETSLTSDDVRYFHRWGQDVSAEFQWAVKRRRFFEFYQPEQEAGA